MTNHMFIILQTNVRVYHISVFHNLVMYFDKALSNCWIGRGGKHDLLTNSIWNKVCGAMCYRNMHYGVDQSP
jgi:hypothetical protein